MMEDEDAMLMDTMDNPNDFGPLTSPPSTEVSQMNPHTPLTPATPKPPTPIMSSNPGATDLDKANSVHSKDEDEHSDDDIEGDKGLDDDKVNHSRKNALLSWGIY